MQRSRWITIAAVAASGLLATQAAFAQFTNGQAAIGVLGPADLLTRPAGAAAANRFNGPNGVAICPLTGKIFVTDRANHRVLRWTGADALNDGSAAEAVIGQADFTTATSGLAANKFNNPIGITVDAAGRLWVSDYSNNRVLRFDDAANRPNGASADGVLGQPDFVTGTSATSDVKMSGPAGIFADGAGRLWVSNFNNHRVLRFDAAAGKANGAAADAVLGQPDFTTSTSGLSASKCNNANSVYLDAAGRLWVSEFTNRRVLRYDDAANKPNGAAADAVLGQPDFVTNSSGVTQNKFGSVRFVTGDGAGRIYVVEEANNRVMIFDDAANLANGADADFVLGQATFTTNAGPNPPNASSLATPRALALNEMLGHVWVADWANNRVVRYAADLDTTWTLALTSPAGGENWTVGSSRNITWTSANIASVKLEYSLDGGATWTTIVASTPGGTHAYAWTVPSVASRDAKVRISSVGPRYMDSTSPGVFTIFDDTAWTFVNGQPAVGVLGPADLVTRPAATVTASRFNGPNGVALDPATGKLFVADRGNHRVLRWASAAAYANGSAAEAVLGQPDFTTATVGVSAVKMNNPIGLCVDAGGRLWVGDFSNNRVLRFDGAATKASGSAADGVLGQPDFTTGSSATSAVKMNGPVGLWADGAGRLWVSNFNNHRVLRFDDAANKPNGAAADGVLGQLDFVTGTSGLTQSKLANPNAVYADGAGRVWVSDYANRRALRFDDAANKPNGAPADGVLGQPDFTTNTTGVTQSKFGFTRYVAGDAAGRLYVVEEANNRVMIFNGAAGLANGAPADYVLGQATFTTNTGPNPPNASSLATPRAIAVDELLGHLWLADWANHRVLRYELGHAGAVSLSLASPNGGEDWLVGNAYNVTWSSQNVSAVHLEYSVDDGANWLPIASGVPASPPSYSWTVPNTPTATARVRITSATDPLLTDTSAAPFTISVPVQSLALVSPNGLQQWEAGAQKKILFTSANVPSVRIETSADGGGNWSEVAASAPAAGGSYLWTVPASTGSQYRVRVTSTTDPLVTDASDQDFAVVPEVTGDEFDYLFFSDSPTAGYYDPSYTAVTAPSLLERASGDKAPVSAAYSLVGNYALKLAWTSATGGDWMMANAGIGWPGRDVTVKDSLVFRLFTEAPTASAALPCIYLEDLSNRKTIKLPLANFMGDVPAGGWQRVAIPVQAFEDNPGTADLTRVKTIFLGQLAADAAPHTWYLDDFRMTGGRPQTGDSTKLIVVIGSSTAAGTGASTTDSSWVGRFRNHVRGLDPTAVVVNLAIGGYTTYHVMPTGYVPPAGRPSPSPANNITMALAYRPWAILVNLPSNDVTSGYSIAEQLANYDTLRARAAAAGVPMWITTAQPRNLADPLQRDQLRIMSDSTLSRYAPYGIAVYEGLAAADGTIKPEYNSGDGIHLNDAGHRFIYQQVIGADPWSRMLPQVDVTYPDGGEHLWISLPDTIRWTAVNTSHVTGYDVELSRTGLAGPWTSLGQVGAGQFKLGWVITPPDVYDSCYVRVTALGTDGPLGSGRSGFGFSILDPATPALLSTFTAEPVAGGVELRWMFGDGSNAVSETLERGETAQGPWVEVAADRRVENETRILVDRDAPAGELAYYRLVVRTAANETITFGPVSATATPAVTEFALGSIAPNPAAGLVRVEFALPVAARVELTLMDVQGRVAARLADGAYEPGRHVLTWNSRASVRSGMYFLRLRTAGREFHKRMVLVN